jgi:hypothetical protein
MLLRVKRKIVMGTQPWMSSLSPLVVDLHRLCKRQFVTMRAHPFVLKTDFEQIGV